MDVSSIEYVWLLINETLKDQAWKIDFYRKENAELQKQNEELRKQIAELKGDNEK